MKTLINRKYVIATIKSWNIEEAKKFIARNLDLKVLLITDKKRLTYQKIKSFNPRYILFPHWSWIIPESIFKNYECIVFHMTDLPFGRGGSPLQNLIVRGINRTKISAVRVVKELDAGPIYLKRSLSLRNGRAETLLRKASRIVFRYMIPYILKKQPKPLSQKGKVVIFKRRTPKESNIAGIGSLKKVYDHIRILDAEGYPLAFIETSALKIEFFDAKLTKNYVLANARIKVKNEYKNFNCSSPSR